MPKKSYYFTCPVSGALVGAVTLADAPAFGLDILFALAGVPICV